MWQIAKKDLYIFFADKKALFLTLLLPIGLITLFAFAFGGVGQSASEPNPVILQYSDLDNSPASAALIARLDSISGIRMEAVDTAAGMENIRKGNRIALLVIDQGLEPALAQQSALPAHLFFDESQAMEVSILQNMLRGMLGQMRATAAPAPESAGHQEPEASNLQMVSVVGDETSNWGLIQAVAGTAIMMLLFSVSAIGASIIEEKEQGVLRRLLQSPQPAFSLLNGKLIFATIIALFQLVVMFLFAWMAFGLPVGMNLPGLILMIVVTALCCSSFGVLLASVADSKRQADSLGTIIILFMSAIGGSMIPLYIMPGFMQDIAVISVNYWSIQGFYDIFWRQLGIEALTENVLILLGYTVVLLTLSYYFFRRKALRL
ncbi:MAG: ABC transporter permease [Chitinophagales bacterium]|nr:ABC transporter permease [Chitinophagales bacterium]HAE13550.1 hypothetical protein [Bacteroidota bacterium]MCB9021351.1 ABC transporter permease [Chitinophagales bacterium]MCB9031694.1 ABC transporter permease [Chitinophagales bacterium]HAE35424.1 hypothetical protein [Bacteroidota bacterium]